jgi:hypothetical protein
LPKITRLPIRPFSLATSTAPSAIESQSATWSATTSISG